MTRAAASAASLAVKTPLSSRTSSRVWLLPATTALGTAAEGGRELGVKAGANVVMPNLSPENVREKYLLYDNKIHTGREAAECLEDLKQSMAAIGYEVVVDRGDFIPC